MHIWPKITKNNQKDRTAFVKCNNKGNKFIHYVFNQI